MNVGCYVEQSGMRLGRGASFFLNGTYSHPVSAHVQGEERAKERWKGSGYSWFAADGVVFVLMGSRACAYRERIECAGQLNQSGYHYHDMTVTETCALRWLW